MLTCSQTRAVQSHIIMPAHLNGHHFLYGGQMMMWLDETAGISAMRLTRQPTVTATIDQFNFVAPMKENDSICIETFVSGVGKKSLEVFCKVIGEELYSGKRYLAATGFMTWAVPNLVTPLPSLHPETAEEKLICAGYHARRTTQLAARADTLHLNPALKITSPWQT